MLLEYESGPNPSAGRYEGEVVKLVDRRLKRCRGRMDAIVGVGDG